MSELKAYINHKRIVIVLGYDEDYIHDALSSQLPPRVDVNEYIKKIITLRKNIPNPKSKQLRRFSSTILRKYLSSVEEGVTDILSRYATQLCDFNPRKLKRLLLSFLQHIPSEPIGANRSVSLLLTIALDEEGFLLRREILESFNSIGSERLQEVLSEITEPELLTSSRVILRALESWERRGSFYTDTINYLGIPQYGMRSRPTEEEDDEERKLPAYDWRTVFIPILQNASMFQPIIPGSLIYQDKDFKLTKIEQRKKYPNNWRRFLRYVPPEMKSFIFESNDYNIFIILPSFSGGGRSRNVTQRIISVIHNNAPLATMEKPFVIWLIDDEALLVSRYESHLERTRNISEGLKNEIILLITNSEQINDLFSFLLSILSSTSEQQAK